MPEPLKIILSRTDSIGDLILSLPMAGLIKEHLPDAQVWVLGKSYTRAIVSLSEYVDGFLNWDDIKAMPSETERIVFLKSIKADAFVHVFPVREIAVLARKAGIRMRIGTSGRLYHYLNCNHRPRFSRRRSNLHEAQLNLKLLRPLGIKLDLKPEAIYPYYGFTKVGALSEEFAELLDPNKTNLIIHPKSKGSAREWGLDNFARLLQILPEEKYKVFMTGTEHEGQLSRPALADKFPSLIDVTGKMNLEQLIAFIHQADGLIAASTGPLHIAASLGKWCLGIYPPIRPMHPGRWAPLGPQAHYLVEEKPCEDCRKTQQCACMENITAETVKLKLEAYGGP